MIQKNMNAEEFGKMYLRYEENIKKVLQELKIYDEDLVHDAYIAVYEYGEKAEIGDFVNTFVAFYKNLHKRRKKDASYFETCDNATMIEKYDRIDEDDWERREQVLECIDDIIDEFCKNPIPGKRNHERACEVLQLYRNGLTFREIAAELGIKCSTAHAYFSRAIKALKANKN